MFAENHQYASLQHTFATIFKRSPHPVIIKDENSRFLYLSDAACDLIGVRLDELLGRTDYDFLPSGEADTIRAIDIEILASGNEKLFEETITAFDGSQRTLKTQKRRLTWPSPGGTLHVVIAEIEDVTELRSAEQVLRASEEYYRSLIELHPETPWVANPAGEVIEVGKEWAHLSGQDLAEAVGYGWEASIHPSDLTSVRRSWKKAIRSKSLLDAEFRIRTAPGDYRWFRSRAAPKLDPEGDVVRWYGLLEDVHDRHLAVEALSESERCLREHRDKLEKIVERRTAEVHQKNAELDQLLQQEREVNALQRRFVAMISHEFRTPLAIIDSAAQRLTRTKAVVTSDYLAEKSTQIKSAVARMVELMESILAAGRLQTGTIEIRRQEYSLSALVEECAERRRQLNPAHIFHLDLEHLPMSVSFDREAIERVFSNLLSNAVKYSPAAPHIFIRGWAGSGTAKIEIRDSGIGIDIDDLPRLFESYFRARSAAGIAGTGIGLNIVREIVELHGGEISVESAIGVGTKFTVTLPISSEPSQEKAA